MIRRPGRLAVVPLALALGVGACADKLEMVEQTS
jgi:hypothetical protein